MVHVLRQSVHDWLFLVTSALVSFFSMQCHADISVYRWTSKQQIDGGYRAYVSKFGPPLDPEGFEGFVTNSSEDGTGCNASLIQPPPSIYSNHHWILLLQRGNCSFVEKVRNAQLKQYDMVIVFNNASSVEPMYGKNTSDIYIPSVFVSQHTGLIIKNKYQYFNDAYVLVDDSNFPFDINPDLLLPFAVIVAVCFITMISFMICKCIRDRRRALRHRLPASSLGKIPIEKYSPKTCRYETCAICLEDYIDGEKLRVLPCSHAYHTKCIDPWLTRNRRVCPICKRKVFASNEVPVDGSDSDSDVDSDDRTPLVRGDTRTLASILRSFLRPEPERFNNSISSSNSSISGSSTNSEDHVQVQPALIVRSINGGDYGSTSNASSSFSYPGTSSVQLPHHSRYSTQSDDVVS